MRPIRELYGSGRPVCSFEFFPPKTPQGYASLLHTIAELKELEPGFVSVTWGAGGSVRAKTIELVTEIQRGSGIVAMAHLTCIGSTRGELRGVLERLEREGVRNVLALGGDPPEGYVPPADGLAYASELVALARECTSLSIGGACYPEVHPRAISPEDDLARLREKVEAGAEFLITQLFFDNAHYYRFVDRAERAGIDVPIVPGIMPVTSAQSVRRMASLCKSEIPAALGRRLDEGEDSEETTLQIGIDWATDQCSDLIAKGAPGIHFYTLNRSPATRTIYRSLFHS